jgi:hypothetical protein
MTIFCSTNFVDVNSGRRRAILPTQFRSSFAAVPQQYTPWSSATGPGGAAAATLRRLRAAGEATGRLATESESRRVFDGFGEQCRGNGGTLGWVVSALVALCERPRRRAGEVKTCEKEAKKRATPRVFPLGVACQLMCRTFRFRKSGSPEGTLFVTILSLLVSVSPCKG